MKPALHPEEIVSEMGRRVLDLRERGWASARIARHIGVDKALVVRLVTDPNSQPRHPAGMLLVELHSCVMTQCSVWTRVLNELRIAGLTYKQIALKIGTSEEYLKELRADPTIAPNYSLGERLLRLRDHHNAPPQGTTHDLNRTRRRNRAGRGRERPAGGPAAGKQPS